ncbi:MAG: TrkA family potassium uptake protein [Candidatus Aminicenantes bacterium]|nr:TrkA family potassium uptake protein [Candidatus Aminicenantes bacterium]
MKKRIVVIGMGIFGRNIVEELYENGFEVVAIDKDPGAVQGVRDHATKAIVADATDRDIVERVGIQEDDTVIISFGEDLAASTLITLNLKQNRIKTIIVKAPNRDHKAILEKVGATQVLIPEMEMAHKVARGIISPNVIDYIPLSDEYTIFEMAPPERFLGKSIGELQLRTRFHIEVIAVRELISDRFVMVPPASFVIDDGQVLLVVGREKDIQRIS